MIHEIEIAFLANAEIEMDVLFHAERQRAFDQ